MNLPRQAILLRNEFCLTLLRLCLNILRVSWQRNQKFHKIRNNSIFIICINFNSKGNFRISLLIIDNIKTKKPFKRTIHSIFDKIELSVGRNKGNRSIIFEFCQSDALVKFNILNIDCFSRSTTAFIDVEEFFIIQPKHQLRHTRQFTLHMKSPFYF